MPSERWIWLGGVLSGLLLGAGHLHPGLWFCAWLGVALWVVCVEVSTSRWRRAAIAFVAPMLMHVSGFFWILWLFPELVHSAPPQTLLWSAGLWLACTLPIAVPLGLVAVVAPRGLRALCVPVAWALGEATRAAMLPITTPDWLVTQTAAPGVLRAVGPLGWWPTLLLCLCGAAGLGAASARRDWRGVVLPLVVLGGLWLLPARPSAGRELFDGVGVVHTNSTLDLPHTLPNDVELLVWPEAALDLRPTLIEGEAVAGLLPPLVPGTSAVHLIGMVTNLPGFLPQNQLVQVAADGAVQDSRAKRVLLPVAERRLWGLGSAVFRPGRLPSPMNVMGRWILPSICGELLDRRFLWAGHQGPGTLLVIPARDRLMPGLVPRRQLLAMQRLRSAELGVPSVRASLYGWSSFVDANGQVVALSTDASRHILQYDAEVGAVRHDYWGEPLDRDSRGRPPEPRVAVLFDPATPHLRTRCPQDRCAYYAVTDPCPGRRYDTVVVAGHADPPTFLGTDAAGLAASITCFEPSLVVVDACYGASLALLDALSAQAPLVIAAPSLVPEGGLHYGAAFFGTGSPQVRAEAVQYPGGTLTRVHPYPDVIASLRQDLAALDDMAGGTPLPGRRVRLIRLDLDDGGVVVAPSSRR